LTGPRRIAVLCALAALFSNLVIEYFVTAAPASFVIIPGLADFYRTWNHGVSFSLLVQNSDNGRYLLIAALATISIAVAVMAWRAVDPLTAAGFGLVLGGALGNLWDRVFYGAVFDFLSFHLASLPLFVCNFADIAISAGVILLLAESLLVKQGERDFAD
jgi:lipoprotein signal peptidase